METHVSQMCGIVLVIFLSGILAGDWSVNIPNQICTVTGSSVVLPCSYDFPESKDGLHVQVKAEMWCLGNERCITPRYVYHSENIFLEPSLQSRVEYLGKLGSKNCSLKISSLQESDSGTYVFYLVTNHTTEKMPAQKGIQLLVSGSPLAVSVLAGLSSVIVEGESVRLSCCSFEQSSEVLWFQTSSAGPKHNGSEWAISKTKREDSGSYYCQVQSRGKVQTSEKLVLDVQYPPRNTVISASSPVTLTCSSEANPPVRTFTWYKGAACDPRADTSFHKAIHSYESATGGGVSVSRIDVSSGPSEVHCCVARNRHGSQKSSTISTSSAETPNSGGRMVFLGVTIAGFLALIAIIAVVIKRRKKSSRNQSYALAGTSAEI